MTTEWLVEPGFEAVAEEFERNFTERGELGAAFAAYVEGKPVVDIWGGTASTDQQRPWEKGTLQLIFSGTKGLVAICLLMLIERARLNLESSVSEYWPEFSAGEKKDITVRNIVTHTARLPGIAEKIGVADVADDRRMAALLAAQQPFGDRRAARAYHPLTYGWLCGELVRRIDGRSIGRFFAEEIADPLNLDVFLGLPDVLEARVSQLELAGDDGESNPFDPAVLKSDALLQAVWSNPEIWTEESFPWNSELYRRSEIPGANAIGTARAIAELYGSLDQLLSAETLALGTSELERRTDELVDEPQAFGVGFALQTELEPFGPPTDGFGHTGAGGSVHGRWPREEVGFSYVMNRMYLSYRDGEDPRARALLEALYRCVAPA